MTDEIERQKRLYTSLLCSALPKSLSEAKTTVVEEKKSRSEAKKEYDHFSSNPSIQKILESIPDKDKEEYKKLGKNLYTQDYSKQSYNPYDNVSELYESVSYTIQSLNAGLHPSKLSKMEVDAMVMCKGHEWFSEFGYTREDLVV